MSVHENYRVDIDDVQVWTEPDGMFSVRYGMSSPGQFQNKDLNKIVRALNTYHELVYGYKVVESGE